MTASGTSVVAPAGSGGSSTGRRSPSTVSVAVAFTTGDAVPLRIDADSFTGASGSASASSWARRARATSVVSREPQSTTRAETPVAAQWSANWVTAAPPVRQPLRRRSVTRISCFSGKVAVLRASSICLNVAAQLAAASVARRSRTAAATRAVASGPASLAIGCVPGVVVRTVIASCEPPLAMISATAAFSRSRADWPAAR